MIKLLKPFVKCLLGPFPPLPHASPPLVFRTLFSTFICFLFQEKTWCPITWSYTEKNLTWLKNWKNTSSGRNSQEISFNVHYALENALYLVRWPHNNFKKGVSRMWIVFAVSINLHVKKSHHSHFFHFGELFYYVFRGVSCAHGNCTWNWHKYFL